MCSCVYTFDMHIDIDSYEMSKTKYQVFKVESLLLPHLYSEVHFAIEAAKVCNQNYKCT